MPLHLHAALEAFHLVMPLLRNTYLQIYKSVTYQSLCNYLFGEQMLSGDLHTFWLNSAFYSGITNLFNNATGGLTCLFTELCEWNYLSVGQTLFVLLIHSWSTYFHAANPRTGLWPVLIPGGVYVQSLFSSRFLQVGMKNILEEHYLSLTNHTVPNALRMIKRDFTNLLLLFLCKL